MDPGMIYCVGRNYSDHARELGNAVPESPIIFFKPPKSIVLSDEPVFLPKHSQNVQFEGELVIKVGENLAPESIAFGNDLTARDIQKVSQATGKPWSLAKGFKQSCGIGNWVPIQKEFGIELENLVITVIHNGKLAQKAQTNQMIFPPSFILNFLSLHFPLAPGDLVFTGTPSGVGTLAAGDELHGTLSFLNPRTNKNEILSSGAWSYNR